MSPTTLHASAQSTPEVKPTPIESVYIVVDSNGVVHECGSAEEAVLFTDKHPDGVVYGKLSKSPQGKRRDDMPEENPVAYALSKMSSEQEKQLRTMARDTLCWGHVTEFRNSGMTDLTRPIKSTDRSCRRATNAECALLKFRLKLFGEIDLREDMFQQLAGIMREHAESLTELADELAKTEDTRNLPMIHECIEDKQFLQKLKRGGKEIGSDGQIKAADNFYGRREVEEHLWAAFRDRSDEFKESCPDHLWVHFYGVVDPASVMNPTKSLKSATGFARGRGGHSIVVGLVDAVEGGVE